MKLSKFVSDISAFLFGAVAVFVFLSLGDTNRVSKSAVALFGFAILSPASFFLTLKSRFAAWLIALCMVAGVFFGTCLRLLIPPLASILWPIGAVIWTATFFLPITVGSAVGFVARRKF